MATYRIKPSKPMAVITAVFGVVVLTVGIVTMANKPHHGFLWIWVAFGVTIIGFGLWSAFARSGASQIITTDDDAAPPHLFGQTTERD